MTRTEQVATVTRLNDQSGAFAAHAVLPEDTDAGDAAPLPPKPARPHERYRVSVQEYITLHQQGFLVVRGLVPPDDVQELVEHSEDLLYGRVAVPGLEPPPPGATPQEIERRYLTLAMLHRALEIHERFLLHPRILDVLQALIGPDVMAVQSIFFLKPPGGKGQGYHQDSYYIPTMPDTLCAAWLAVDRADEENGCLWITPGSQNEPIYPTVGRETAVHGDALDDLSVIENPSHTDERVNTLARVAAKYAEREVAVPVEPGDVIFFQGHILHRSHGNHTQTRFRRSFVGHYANARSFTLWDYGRWNARAGEYDPEGANYRHILARGSTHLPFGQPRFGTACAANTPELRGPAVASDAASLMANMADGDMVATAPMDMTRNDAHTHDDHEE